MKERLKKLRKELKLSQDRFAEKIFLTGRALANYESGFRQPDNMTIAMICKVFHVRDEWLRFGEGEMVY
ncbi:hypothetical protein FACS189499_10240 [Clostridia bacterium]|nr:hypothetical protein FACS189499_10240 [Clostridia bacterium]